MKKTNKYPLEIQRWITVMERESRFWKALDDVGFKRSTNKFLDMHHVKHETLPLSCSFRMLPRTLHIWSFTDPESHSWVHPSIAYYKRNDGVFVTPCSRLIMIIEPEEFIKMLIHYARKMANQIFNKLDNRTI